MSHHPTRWARNPEDGVYSTSFGEGHHPTRWARNKLFITNAFSLNMRHHPTRWARNSLMLGGMRETILVTIPHGGLGTLAQQKLKKEVKQVTIPHGGLGTKNYYSVSFSSFS